MSQTHWEEDWELLNMSTVPFFTAGFLASQVFTDHTPRNGEWFLIPLERISKEWLRYG